MGNAIDMKAEVGGLAQRIRAAATDEHEARSLHHLAMQLLHQEFARSQAVSAEAMAQLVIEKRAAVSGISVADQKNAAGALLKKRVEDVTAADVLEVVLFQVAPDVKPVVVADPLVSPGKP